MKRTDGSVGQRVDELMGGWMDPCIDGWMDGWMDECFDKMIGGRVSG